jgi:ribosomal protein S4
MADDNKPCRSLFPVEVTVNGVKVTVTLMLKPGTTVSVAEKEQQETKEDQPQDET